MMVWGLCMDHEGNFIKNPNEILHQWTYGQVADALEIRAIRLDALEAEKRRTKGRRS